LVLPGTFFQFNNGSGFTDLRFTNNQKLYVGLFKKAKSFFKLSLKGAVTNKNLLSVSKLLRNDLFSTLINAGIFP
jgi:hypothetical protein